MKLNPLPSLLIFLCLGGTATAGDRVLNLSREQADHLGVRVAVAEGIDSLPLGRAAARIVLPPDNEYLISAPQTGVIEHVRVALGVSVKQGEIMARIQSPALLEVERSLLDAASEFSLAQARLERDKALLAAGVIARLRWLETQGQYRKAEVGLQTVRQTLKVSGLSDAEIKQLETSHRLSSLIEVRAPVSGRVLERLAVAGQRVELLAPLFRLGQLETLWLEVSVPQERISEITPGDRIYLDNPKASARIIHISQQVDTDSQTALVRAVVEQGVASLRPGMNVTVQLMHNSQDHLFQLPRAALFAHEGKRYVFIKTATGYEAREIGIAGEEEHRIVIHQGIQAGESVVVQGVAGLKAAWLGVGED